MKKQVNTLRRESEIVSPFPFKNLFGFIIWMIVTTLVLAVAIPISNFMDFIDSFRKKT